MAKSHFPLWTVGLVIMASPALLPGQAMVEYGLATAGSGVMGAPGQRASRSIGGVFSNLTKTLDAAKEAQDIKPAAAVPPSGQANATAPAKPVLPAATYEDPAGIQKGMDRAELLRRFGEPSMQITTGGGEESLTYAVKDRRVEVELREGKVASVETKTKPKPQSAVVLLQ